MTSALFCGIWICRVSVSPPCQRTCNLTSFGSRGEDTDLKVPEGEFDFLGYTFGRMYSPTTGKARLGHRPSKKSIKRMVERVHALTDRVRRAPSGR